MLRIQHFQPLCCAGCLGVWDPLLLIYFTVGVWFLLGWHIKQKCLRDSCLGLSHLKKALPPQFSATVTISFHDNQHTRNSHSPVSLLILSLIMAPQACVGLPFFSSINRHKAEQLSGRLLCCNGNSEMSPTCSHWDTSIKKSFPSFGNFLLLKSPYDWKEKHVFPSMSDLMPTFIEAQNSPSWKV